MLFRSNPLHPWFGRVDVQTRRELLSVSALLAVARNDAQLGAESKGCVLTVKAVDSTLKMLVNAPVLNAITNLLQNALKFTRSGTEVTLMASALGNRVRIDVADHCGQLGPGPTGKLFTPIFTRPDLGNLGLGSGLAIARQTVAAEVWTLAVRDVPGEGCVLTIERPLAKT